MTKPVDVKEDFQEWLTATRKWIKAGGELPKIDDSRLLADRRLTARNY